MKILIITTKPPWIRGGGINTIIREVYKRLINKMEIEIVCTDVSGKEVGDRIWEKIPVHVFKGYTSMFHFSPDLLKKLKHIEKFDLIHIHNYSSFSPLALTMLTNNTKTPIIFNPHFHEHGSNFLFSILRHFYDLIVGKYIFDNVQKIICVSEIEKKTIKNKFNINETKIVIVPNGINLEEIRHAVPFQQKENLILYVGRLVKYKNVQLLIQSMQYLPNKYTLVILGKGEYKQKLQNLINNLDLRKRVEIISDLQDNDIYRWIKTCSVLINLSDIEAFGITVIEGLAAKKSIIVNNKFGLSELAKQFNDCVFPIDVHNSSLEQLGKLIIDKSNVESNANLNNYSWEYLTDEIEKIYITEFNKQNSIIATNNLMG